MRLDFAETLVSQECIECGITFAFTLTLDKHLRAQKRPFSCPNGHPQQYTGPTEADKLQKEVERLTERIAAKDREITEQDERIAGLIRSNRALTGAITRMKKRAVLRGRANA